MVSLPFRYKASKLLYLAWTSKCDIVVSRCIRQTGGLPEGHYLSLMKSVKASIRAPREIQ